MTYTSSSLHTYNNDITKVAKRLPLPRSDHFCFFWYEIEIDYGHVELVCICSYTCIAVKTPQL